MAFRTLNSLSAVVCLLLAGCGRSDVPDPYGEDASAADYGALKISRTVNDARVQQQLTGLEAGGQLPDQIARTYIESTDPETEDPVTRFFEGQTAARVNQALDESAHWWNPHSPGRDLLVATQGADFLHDWDVKRSSARALLIQPNVRFPINLQEGYLADPTWIGTIHCLTRAELLAAAKHARGGEMAEAVTAVAFAMALADQLNQVPAIAARVTAAKIREESYITLRALLRHPELTSGHLQTLETVFEQSNRQWPGEVALWQADRAAGLHFLEMVRAGHFASLLTREEYEELVESGELARVTSNVGRNITADQAFYLEAMAKVVELAKRPYFERVEGLNAISDALSQAKTSGEYPLISGDFLLAEMHSQHAALAKDRARLLAWMTALQVANGHAPPVMPVSPFSGKPVDVREEPTRVIATFADLPGEIGQLIIPKLKH